MAFSNILAPTLMVSLVGDQEDQGERDEPGIVGRSPVAQYLRSDLVDHRILVVTCLSEVGLLVFGS